MGLLITGRKRLHDEPGAESHYGALNYGTLTSRKPFEEGRKRLRDASGKGSPFTGQGSSLAGLFYGRNGDTGGTDPLRDFTKEGRALLVPGGDSSYGTLTGFVEFKQGGTEPNTG